MQTATELSLTFHDDLAIVAVRSVPLLPAAGVCPTITN